MAEHSREHVERLKRALDGWERRRSELCRLSVRQEGDWRRQIVRCRRQLHEDITSLGSLLSSLRSGDSLDADIRALRDALCAMRSCAAEHQARWPVITIVPGHPKFQQSLAWLRATGDRFAATAAGFLNRLGQAP